MATITGKHVLLNVKVVLDGNELSHMFKSVDLDMSTDAVEVTSMGNANHTYAPGLGNSKASLEAFQDYLTGSIDDIVSDLVLNRTIFTALLVPDNADYTDATPTPAPENPVYSNTYFVSKYKGINGSVGTAHMTPIELSPTGDLARLVA